MSERPLRSCQGHPGRCRICESKHRYGEVEANDRIGIVSGLAWTEVGGELLTVEGVMIPGKCKMTITGKLRDVMKESISAAASYV